MSSRFVFLFLVAAVAPRWTRAAAPRQTMGDAFEKKPKTEKKVEETATPWTPEDRKRLLDEVTGGFYADGVKAKSSGRLSEAKALFERVLTLDPDHQDAMAQLRDLKRRTASGSNTAKKTTADDTSRILNRFWTEADSCTKKGAWGGAQLALKKILAMEPGNRKAQARLVTAERNYFSQLKRRGEDREKAGDPQGALEAYQVALAHGRDEDLLERIGRLKSKMAEGNRKRAEELYVAALSASQQGNDERALSLCRQALRLDPANLQASRMLERLKNRGR